VPAGHTVSAELGPTFHIQKPPSETSRQHPTLSRRTIGSPQPYSFVDTGCVFCRTATTDHLSCPMALPGNPDAGSALYGCLNYHPSVGHVSTKRSTELWHKQRLRLCGRLWGSRRTDRQTETCASVTPSSWTTDSGRQQSSICSCHQRQGPFHERLGSAPRQQAWHQLCAPAQTTCARAAEASGPSEHC
jgi:hypothetical protein